MASHSPISDAVNTTTSWSDTTTFYVIGVDTTDNNGQNTTLPDTDLPDNTVTDVTVTYGNITLENSTAVSTAGFTTKEPPKISSNIFTSENIATTYLVIGNIGMVTNAFVIIVMSFTPSMWKTFINIYIMNQSVTDFLVSLFLSASYNLNSDVPYPGIRGDIYCKLWLSRTFMWAFLNVSTYNLVLLSMERYAEVLHPFWHKSHVTRKGILISVLVIWVTGTVFELAGKLPPTYVSDGVCVFMRRWPNQAARKAYGFMVVIIKFVVPLVILICAYGRIAWELHKKIEQSTSGKDARLQRGKRNTIKTMAIVSAAFVLCWVWNQVNFLLFNAGRYFSGTRFTNMD